MAVILATVKKTAEFLDVNPSTIHRWIKRKLVKTYQIDGITMISVEDVIKAKSIRPRLANPKTKKNPNPTQGVPDGVKTK